ncbi:MAG: OprD family outer membrane porin [Pseudomonadota bacterium]
MKKAIVLCMVAVVALSASTIDELLAGKASGQIRAAYVNQDNAVDTDTYGTSLGGVLKYETADWNGLKLGVGAYVSQKIHGATGSFEDAQANPDLFGEDTKSYAYVGEAYLDYTMNDFNLRLGRQLIDTPFADTDDIRMHPNTFEAAIATYSGIEGTTLFGGYIKRWAGYDSGDDISKFKKFTENSSGTVVVGVVNESVENLALQGWYYNIDELSNAVYADAVYIIPFSETMGLELSTQYANFSEKKASGMDGNVYGIGAAFNVGALTFGAAYNKASNDEGKSVSNGFGGGPYMTSMEEMTIDGFEDVKAYQLSVELDLADMGLEGLVFTALYGDFKSTPVDMKVKEIDLIAAYEISEALSAEVSYAMIDDKNKNTFDNNGTPDDGGYDRFLVRLNYNF